MKQDLFQPYPDVLNTQQVQETLGIGRAGVFKLLRGGIIKGDIYYAVLNFKDNHGKRNQRCFNLHLPVKGNKRKALCHEVRMQ